VAFGSVEGGSPSSTIAYGYNAAGDLTSAADSRGGTYTLSYDPYNRLMSETGPNGTSEYSYDGDSELAGISLEGEEAASYAYNPDGQLTSIDSPNGNVTLDYDQDGQRAKVQLPDGDSENYSYNGASRLTGIAYKNPAGEEFGNLEYARDALGRISTVSGSYAQTSLPETVSEASYNADNELTSLEGHSYSHDADGNLTSNGTASFEWNDRDQLTGITEGSDKWSFAYDPFGRRTSKTANGTETKYLDNGENVVRESTGAEHADVLNGFGLDERYARTTSTGTDSYLADQLGSMVALANGSGEATTEYTYGPFGAVTSAGTASSNPYQYTGRENDGDGLQYNRARYYSPTTGTFISQDPLGMEGSGTNLYQYTGSNPVNGVDPQGLCNANPFSGGFWSEGNCLSEHGTEIVETGGIAACIVVSAGVCAAVTLGVIGINTGLNYAKYDQCGRFGEHELATVGLGLAEAHLGLSSGVWRSQDWPLRMYYLLRHGEPGQ
jgi:RHS repeat-associated protein